MLNYIRSQYVKYIDLKLQRSFQAQIEDIRNNYLPYFCLEVAHLDAGNEPVLLNHPGCALRVQIYQDGCPPTGEFTSVEAIQNGRSFGTLLFHSDEDQVSFLLPERGPAFSEAQNLVSSILHSYHLAAA